MGCEIDVKTVGKLQVDVGGYGVNRTDCDMRVCLFSYEFFCEKLYFCDEVFFADELGVFSSLGVLD
jgi:hypothetical protein